MKKLIALFAVLAFWLTGCNGTGAQPPSTPGSQALTVGLTYTPDIQFAPFYVADAKGYFKEEGLNVTLRHHGASESLFGALTAGTEQVVYAGGDEMLQARSQGTQVINYATLYQQYPVVLVVRDDSPIKTASDLKGKKVGVPGPYGETWFGLLALLKGAGLTQNDVQIQHIGYTQQAAITTGQVDAVMGYANNDAVRLQAAGVPVRTLPIAEGTVPLVGIGLGATDQTVAQRPEDLAKVLRAVKKATGDIAADPEAGVKLSQKYIPSLSGEEQQKSALATLKASVPLFGDPAKIGAQDAAQWDAMATFMSEQGLLAKPVPAAEAYTSKIG